MRGGVYDILNHKFLTRGHTFLKNDSDFAQIEKRKASAKVFVPSDWFLRWSGRPAAGAPLRSLLCNRKNLRTIRISFVLGTLIDIFLLAIPFFVMFTGSTLVGARKSTQFQARSHCCTYSDSEPW